MENWLVYSYWNTKVGKFFLKKAPCIPFCSITLSCGLGYTYTSSTHHSLLPRSHKNTHTPSLAAPKTDPHGQTIDPIDPHPTLKHTHTYIPTKTPKKAQRSELGSVAYYSGYLDKGALNPFKKPEFKPRPSSLDGTEPPPLGLQQSFVFPRPVMAMGACCGPCCLGLASHLRPRHHRQTRTHPTSTTHHPNQHRRHPHGARDHLKIPPRGVRPRTAPFLGPPPPGPAPARAAPGQEAHGGGAGGGCVRVCVDRCFAVGILVVGCCLQSSS